MFAEFIDGISEPFLLQGDPDGIPASWGGEQANIRADNQILTRETPQTPNVTQSVKPNYLRTYRDAAGENVK